MSPQRRIPTSISLLALLLPALVLLLTPPPILATEKTKEKRFGEPNPDQALVYLIRVHRVMGGAKTLFVFGDNRFLAAVDNGSYTFLHVDEGHYRFWDDMDASREDVFVEAGKTYYFLIDEFTLKPKHFVTLDEQEGRAAIDNAKTFGTTSEAESEHAAKVAGRRMVVRFLDFPVPPPILLRDPDWREVYQ